MRARYYAPNTGRFLSRDTWPIDYQNPVELNRYVYAANNPINHSDPSGLFAMQDYQRPLIDVGIATAGIIVLGSYIIVKALEKLLEDIDVPPFPSRDNKRRWKCTAKCQIISFATQTGTYATGPVTEGHSEGDACRAAKASVQVPPQHYKRHCSCDCWQ